MHGRRNEFPCGTAGMEYFGSGGGIWRRQDRLGRLEKAPFGAAWSGAAGLGLVRHGTAGRTPFGGPWSGKARHGWAGKAGEDKPDKAGPSELRSVKARQALASPGEAWL